MTSNRRTRFGDTNARVDGSDERSTIDATTPGSSLRGTSLSLLMAEKKYRIVCGMEITNSTKFHLTQPQSFIKFGSISMPPISVRPGQKEAMITHKFDYSLNGSSGIVSWLIQNESRRVVVFWECPFFTCNKMAVGLTTYEKDKHKNEWMETIKTNLMPKENLDLRYRCAEFYNTSNEIDVEDEKFRVYGSMGTSNKPEIKIALHQINLRESVIYTKNRASS